MGVILRAKDVATGQEVAIKRVARSKKAEETYASRDNPRNPVTFYRREIDTLRKANHENVVKLLNFEIPSEFSDDSRIACSLVLEFIGGGNLKEYIASRGPLGESETKRITWGIVDGLSHLHRQQISHRDLKPANILLTNTVPPQVRIADFGFSKDFGDGSYLRTMLGTPLYQAPEIRKPQVLMSRTYGTAIDSWALGCTIFEMVTGSAEIFVINPSRKFQARTVQATLPEDRCAANLNVTLLQRVADMSNDCQIIIQSLIVDDAAKRWPCDRVKQSGWFRGFRP
ncbi:kinase-like domain-containing protein [Flagelloscypha sp. PMI_526]|nr:kinase-like domain-containing protein [Flagelloscypha sp. PMI_526]